jgi:hypothetical protein
MIFQGGMRSSPITRIARTLATILIFRGIGGKIAGSRAAATKTTRMPVKPPQRIPAPPGPRPVTRPRWVQPELPLPRPPTRGEQLELPLNVASRPSPQPRWTQLRLPDKTANPPRWRQSALPIRLRYEQIDRVASTVRQ